MPNTYSSLYCHTIFAVKFRHAAIQNSFKKELFGVLGNLINESGCSTVIVNGVSDHVHALFKFYPKNSIDLSGKQDLVLSPIARIRLGNYLII